MAAVFGVVGSVTREELDEMGRRLAHRGAARSWEEVARGVYLGQVSAVPRAPCRERGISMVVDAPEGPPHEARGRILHAFLEARRARQLDETLAIPFALAAWDEAEHTLLLARDFLGLKPLYLCRLPGGGIAFATEYKALLALHAVPARADLRAVQALQVRKVVPARGTLLAGVESVPAGCIMRIARGDAATADRMPGVKVAVREMTETQACKRLYQELERATASLVSDRSRIGFALSGGIDSVSVAYLARQCAPAAELVAFTTGHGEADPEVQRAARVMEELGGRHHGIVVSNEELLAELPLAVWHLENPVGRSETFQFFALARLARERGFDTLLTGMGADLLFGGMPRHKVLWLAQRLPPLRRDLLAFYRATQTGSEPSRWPARALTRLYYRGSLPPVPAVRGGGGIDTSVTLAAPGAEFLNRCLILDAREPTSASLARIERPFQAFGIEYASPYLDREVMRFAFTIPGRLKIHRGVQKYVLRQAMRPLMSERMHKAPKELMRMTRNADFAATLRRLAAQYLSAERVRRRGFFERDQVERVVRGCGDACHPEAAMRLWTLIVTEMWAEIFLDGRGRTPARAPVAALERSDWMSVASAAHP